jgi:chemotaxis protein MotB
VLNANYGNFRSETLNAPTRIIIKFQKQQTIFMTHKKTMFALLLGAVIFSSCVSSKKFKASQAQVSDLQSQNCQLVTENGQLKTNVNDLTAQNKAVTDQFNSYKTDCEAQAEQLKKVQAAADTFMTNAKNLEEKVNAAEAEFQAKGMNVISKDGVLYVDMEDNLLYKSGSSTLSRNGRKALGNLASVLNEMPKLKVIVTGNTDNVPVKGNSDNWTLSTARANGVIRILVNNYKIDPSRLTAAGQGKFSPTSDNTTAEGRAKNRNTQIILNPDWERLWQSVKE